MKPSGTLEEPFFLYYLGQCEVQPPNHYSLLRAFVLLSAVGFINALMYKVLLPFIYVQFWERNISETQSASNWRMGWVPRRTHVDVTYGRIYRFNRAVLES